jgi:CobQ/CobB/MinD/ParA nucleotide binding domain
MTMTTPIFLVGGGKGGVGKSMLSMALLDYLRGTGDAPLLIETDTSAPDVWKTYKADVDNHCIDLEQRDGWLELLDVLDKNADTAIVINTKAANQVGLRKFGGMLTEALRQQNRKLIALWVIDRKRDGLELLSGFLETLAKDERVHVHVVRNLYWGDEAKFDMYNGSELRKEIEQRGGRTLNFPDVADRVSETINRERMPIHRARQELPFGSRVELVRWQNEYKQMFAEVIP